MWSSAPPISKEFYLFIEERRRESDSDKPEREIKKQKIKGRRQKSSSEWWNIALLCLQNGWWMNFQQEGNSSLPYRPQHISVCPMHAVALSSETNSSMIVSFPLPLSRRYDATVLTGCVHIAQTRHASIMGEQKIRLRKQSMHKDVALANKRSLRPSSCREFFFFHW